jgi:hypothetical protein
MVCLFITLLNFIGPSGGMADAADSKSDAPERSKVEETLDL